LAFSALPLQMGLRHFCAIAEGTWKASALSSLQIPVMTACRA
jgi:hypothetical protein